LTACAPMRSKSAIAPVDIAVSRSVKPVARDQDLLLKLIAAQFALQTGDFKSGARGYTEAAVLSPDPEIAEVATQLALSTADWDLATTALARWQQLVPRTSSKLKSSKQESSMQQARGWIALGRNRPEEATAEFAQLLAADSSDNGWRLVAQAMIAVEAKAAATQVLQQLTTPEHLGSKELAWLATSQLAWKLGDKALAQRLADQALERFHGVETYKWSARLAIDRGDREAARDIYANALKRESKNASLRSGYAALLSDMGDNTAAAKLLADGPQDDQTFAARAAYAARGEDKPTLLALYRELKSDPAPHSGPRIYLLGQLAEMNDDWAQALNWYREVPDDDERWFDAQTRQAVVLDQQGKTDAAIELLRRLETSNGINNDELGKIFLVEGDLFRQHKRTAEVLSTYNRGLNFLPDDPRLLYARGLLAAEANDVEAAERDLRRVIALQPNDAAALNALGYTLADRTDRHDEALDLINKAYKLKPDDASIVDSLGWVQYRRGKVDAAIKLLREAWQKQPDPEIAAHFGEVLWVGGDHVQARDIWEKGRKKEPDNKTLLETIKRLTS
ncbi:MAG: tetratricopeptide repeat protein, partial [Dokdonella sp.]